MANAYHLQIALDYVADIRECLVKLEEMDLQEVIGKALEESEKRADEMFLLLEAAEPDLDPSDAV